MAKLRKKKSSQTGIIRHTKNRGYKKGPQRTKLESQINSQDYWKQVLNQSEGISVRGNKLELTIHPRIELVCGYKLTPQGILTIQYGEQNTPVTFDLTTTSISEKILNKGLEYWGEDATNNISALLNDKYVRPYL